MGEPGPDCLSDTRLRAFRQSFRKTLLAKEGLAKRLAKNASLSARVGYGGIEKRGDDKDKAGNDEQTYPRHVARAVPLHGNASVLA
jgi:hypothetical protein